MTDLTKILAENQKEMLKLIAPASKKRSVNPNLQDSDSDQENISVARTSTPVKTQTATSSKTTPNNSRNKTLPTSPDGTKGPPFVFFGTVRLFFRNVFKCPQRVPPWSFLLFCYRMRVYKSKRAPFYIFWHCATFSER